MIELAHWFGWLLVAAAIPTAWAVWYRLDKRGHDILGPLLGGVTHAGLLGLGVVLLLT